jgi:hypothetical protein
MIIDGLGLSAHLFENLVPLDKCGLLHVLFLSFFGPCYLRMNCLSLDNSATGLIHLIPYLDDVVFTSIHMSWSGSGWNLVKFYSNPPQHMWIDVNPITSKQGQMWL